MENGSIWQSSAAAAQFYASGVSLELNGIAQELADGQSYIHPTIKHENMESTNLGAHPLTEDDRQRIQVKCPLQVIFLFGQLYALSPLGRVPH